MKRLITLLFSIGITGSILGQVSGNINYQNRTQYAENSMNIGYPSSYLSLSVKGLANIKADSYVAIFALSQVGQTAEEVNTLMDKRIAEASEKIVNQEGVEIFVDMISFVPVYEVEVEKKLFSKNTYNEIPTGFELKKNIHIKYKNPDYLNEIIADFANAEIYDLVRVDYFSEKIEEMKKELRSKAKLLIQEKLNESREILDQDMDSLEKRVTDGFRVVLPVEAYQSYMAYNSSSLNLKKAENVNHADKSKTLFYQPVMDKEFDFVINPTIFEPVIQVMYEIKLSIEKPTAPVSVPLPDKQYYFVTPNGEVRNLNIN